MSRLAESCGPVPAPSPSPAPARLAPRPAPAAHSFSPAASGSIGSPASAAQPLSPAVPGPGTGPTARSGSSQQGNAFATSYGTGTGAVPDASGGSVSCSRVPAPGDAPPSGPAPQRAASSSLSRSSCSGPLGGGSGRRDSGSGGGGFTPECRICLLSEPVSDLVAACHCTGSLTYAHLVCLRTWVIEKRSIHCELCGTMYKEPYGSDLAASIPPAPPPPPPQVVRRITTPDGQQIIIMPVGVGLGPGAIGPLLQQYHAAAAGGGGHGGGGPAAVVQGGPLPDPRDLEPQPLCEWRNMWSYALILLLLLFAIIYVTVISKRGRQEPWMMTLWQVLLVVLPIYLVLRIAFDLYRHRLAQQLAAANMQAVALANAAADVAAASGPGGGHPGAGGVGPREVIITRAGNRVLVLQRAVP